MIIIGEKINGAIPSIKAAIAGHDEALIVERTLAQAKAGADFLDCAPSTATDIEYETMVWLIGLMQGVTQTPLCIDSPNAKLLARILEEGHVARPGMVNSVNEEGDKCETIFPLIAGTPWHVVGLTCDRDGIPADPEKKIDIAKRIIDKADKYGVALNQLHIDPCVMAIATMPTSMKDFERCIRGIHEYAPTVKVTGAISNISFDMRGTAMDMRKRPEKLEAALEMLSDFLYPAVTNAFKNYNPDDDRYALFARITSLAHTMLNKKQFGKYSWPFYQKFCQDVAERDWCGWLFFEGSVAHLVDYLREIPAGHFALLIEQDDPVMLKKALPNLTICGGYPIELLQNGTKQQCIDKAKQLIDDMAWDGNYIFSTDKMMSFPQDGKGENLKAVIDFVKEYGKY